MFAILILIAIAIGVFVFFKRENEKFDIKPSNTVNDLWRDAVSNEPPQSSHLPTAPTKTSIGYRKHRYILTKAERSFYGILQAATKENYEVFIKVRIADVLKPDRANRSEWQSNCPQTF